MVRRRRGFAAVALLCALALQESLARWLLPLPAVHNFHRVRYQPGPARGEFRCVDLLIESEPDGFCCRHRLNQHGFRGAEFPIARTAARRLLVVGDSFVEGWGVDDHETIPRRLSEQFPGLEGLNLGVSGAGLPEYAALIADAVPLLKPDEALVVLYANDLPCPQGPAPRDPAAAPTPRRDWLPRVVAATRDVFRGHRVAVRGWRPTVRYLPRIDQPDHPFFGRELPVGLAPDLADAIRRGTFNPWQWDCRDRADAALGMEDDPRAAACLAAIADTCRRHGVRLTVAYIPYAFAVSERYLKAYDRLGCRAVDVAKPWDGPERRGQQRFLARTAAALGVPFVDTTDALISAERERGTPMFWTCDLHGTPAGYAVMAEALARAIRR